MTSDAEIANAIDRLAKAVKSVPRDSDHMSSVEVDELKRLVEHMGDGLAALCDARAYSEDEAKNVTVTDPQLVGVWGELASMGLISTSFSDNKTQVDAVEPRGIWALERLKLAQAKEEADEKRRDRHDWRIAIMTGVFGFVGVIAGCILTWALNTFAPSAQVEHDQAEHAAACQADHEHPDEPGHVERAYPVA